LSSRLFEIEAIFKVLMTSNKELRNTVDQLRDTNDKNKADSYLLQVENTDLMDCIEIVESVRGSEEAERYDEQEFVELTSIIYTITIYFVLIN